MSYVKNKKTVIDIGSSQPATATLAAAITAADTGFGCIVDTMDGLEISRGTTEDPAVYCTSDTTFIKQDTEEMQISPFTIEGFVNDEVAGDYLAVKALADTMIRADTQGTMVITEPDGTTQSWFEIKFTNVSSLRGGAQDKQRFRLEVIAMTLPADA